MPDTPRAKKLWNMVDPWIYRAKLTMPIMIINGANDPYWTLDALNLYWKDLPAQKNVLYVPNAGHNLRQKRGDGREDTNRALNTLAVFARHQIEGTTMPKLTWNHSEEDGKCCLRVQSQPAPAAARLWVVDAPTRDFRKARWREQPVAVDEAGFIGKLEVPADGSRAFFAEADFRSAGIDYSLSTQIRVVDASK
jgi:PhoPQ-activated pathogenicity-related protein